MLPGDKSASRFPGPGWATFNPSKDLHAGPAEVKPSPNCGTHSQTHGIFILQTLCHGIYAYTLAPGQPPHVNVPWSVWDCWMTGPRTWWHHCPRRRQRERRCATAAAATAGASVVGADAGAAREDRPQSRGARPKRGVLGVGGRNQQHLEDDI